MRASVRLPLVCGALVALVLSLGAATAAAPAAAARNCADQDLVPTASNAKQIRASIRCLINKERTSRGIQPVAANRELRRAAERYSELMVRRHFIAHVSPGGSTVADRVKRTKYLKGAAKWFLGENLGSGEDPSSSPRALMRAWMASRVHRAHILDDEFRDVGVGFARGTPKPADGPGATYCVEFGRRYKR